MIKTLRITSIVAAILTAVFVVIPVVSGFRGDEEIERLLTSPGVIEKFKEAKGDSAAKRSDSQISPLVKQAEAFALYLNPPTPKRRPAPVRKPSAGVIKPRPAKVSAKFKLIGTSFYAQRPEMSLALIDEPGKGRRWVRQSSSVGHLIIEQVKDGLVVLRDGQRTFELSVVDRPKKRSIVVGDSASGQPTYKSPVRPVSGPGKADARITRPKPREISPEEREAEWGKIMNEMKAMISEKAGSEGDDDKAAELEKFISDMESMRVSDEEAEGLDRLGKQLNVQDLQRNPDLAKRDKSRGDRAERKPGRRGVDIPDANVPEVNSPE